MDWLNINFMKKLSIILILIASLMASRAEAAQILFESPAAVSVGDNITVKIRIDTEGDSINAVDLGVIYPANLSVKNISKAGSVIQLWVKEPSHNGNVIFLSGGLPGGVKSSNALVATVVFEARSIGSGALGLSPQSAALLNDGAGTAASVTLVSPIINIVARKANQAPNDKIDTKTDTTRPKSFPIVVATDPRVFHGKYFVSFFTSDSGSGLDRYEIREGRGPYKVAQSPYLLSDQELRTVIKVRAYDESGNYRDEIYPNLLKRFWWWISSMF